MSPANIDLSVIVISYNSKKFLPGCLESLYSQAGNLELEVFVVDNNSNDGSQALIEKSFPKVRLIQNRENAGFAKANNQAILKSSGRYVLLLNPDVVVKPDAIAKLVKFMEIHPDAGAAGCKLLNDDGSLQYSIGNFPNLVNQIGVSLLLHRLFPRLTFLSELATTHTAYRQTRRVDWVFGAALMVPREVIGQVGLLDEDFFLFSEEKDWCYRIKQSGKNIYFYPEAQMIHYGRGSGTSPAVFAQLLSSKILFIKKHHSAAGYSLAKMVTLFNLAVRIFVWTVLNARRRLSRRQKAEKKLALYREAMAKILLVQ